MIQGPAGELFVSDGGEGGLPVLFVHSSAGNVEQWRGELDRLRAGRRAVAFDVRGHGRSSRPDDSDAFRIRALAGDVEAVVDALDLGRFALVGHSMGASVALEYAARHPDRVAGLVLVDGASHREGDLPPDAADFIEALRGERYPELVEQYWEQILQGGDPDVRRRVLADLRKTPKESVVGVIDGILAYDHLAAAGEWSGPTLLVLSPIGDDDTALHHHVDGIESVVIEDAAHWLHLDRPERFAEVLDGFLGRLDAES